MKWLKRLAIALVVLIVLTTAMPFFITLNRFIPEIEQQASARLNEPVTVKSLQFGLLPVPHLTVDGITVGKDLDIKLGKVTITPVLLSVF